MSYYLFLDDNREVADVKWCDLPAQNYVIVRSYAEFVDYITKHGLPVYITFDHDLGIEHYPRGPQTGREVIEYDKYREKTGYHCARWLVDYCLDNNKKLPQWNVHSMNVVGRKNIIQLLANFARVHNAHRLD